MHFFADECFMPQAVRLLEAFDPDNEIRHLLDQFQRGTPDEQWIAALAKRSPRPIVLSGDSAMLRNKVERAAMKDADLTFVLLAEGWLNAPWHDYAWKIVKAWPNVVSETQSISRSTIFRLSLKSLKMERIRLTSAL